jgi:hypothetical protein
VAFKETVADLASLTVPHYITRENVDELLDKGLIEVHMTTGRWWSVRRNGRTKRWKRDKTRIYIPIKYGLKMCAAIGERDFSGPKGSLRTDFFRVKPN